MPGEALLKTAYTLTAGKVDGKVVTGITWFDQLSQKYSISGLTKIFNSNQARFANYYKIVFTPETDVMAICADFSSQPDVVYAEPNGIYYAAGLPEPTDPLYIKQWALTKIQAPQAWEITTGNATVVVGVLDSGTDIGWPHLPSPHPDLETNLWNENGMYGYNVIDPGRQPYDNLGHGTHCAGVIGAVNNNATGVCGIAGGWGATPGVKVMTVKCLDSTGGTEEAILAEAVRWAADPDDNPATQDGARILSMSLGGPGKPNTQMTLQTQIGYAHDECGCVLVACAQNYSHKSIKGENLWIYPACWDSCIAVTATDINDTITVYTNIGNAADVAAPGGYLLNNIEEGVLSTTPHYKYFHYYESRGCNTYYEYMHGTSMATPYVSGLAGLILSKWPALTNDQVRERILGTADNINMIMSPKWRDSLGTGRINAYKALTMNPQPVVILCDAKINTSAGYFRVAGTGHNELILRVRNIWLDAGAVDVNLLTNDPYVSVTQPSVSYGAIDKYKYGENLSSPFEFTISDACPIGKKIKFYADITAYKNTVPPYPPEGYAMIDSFEIEVQPGLQAGFPIFIGGSIEGSPNSADLNGDGFSEIVVGSTNNILTAVDKSGAVLWSFPTGGPIRTTPAIGDIDNDGKMETAIASNDGYLYVIEYDGGLKWKYYIGITGGETYSGFFYPSPVMADIDNDGILEIICIKGATTTVALEGDGTVKWEKALDLSPTYATPAIGDMDNDGRNDIIVLTSKDKGCVYALNGQNGQILWQNNLITDFVFTDKILSVSPAIGDINCDGLLEIICCGTYAQLGGTDDYYESGIFYFTHEGSILKNITLNDTKSLSFTLSDFNGDNYLESIVTGVTKNDIFYLDVYSHNGDLLKTASITDPFSTVPIIGSRDNYGLRIIAGSPNYNMVYNIGFNLTKDYDIYTVDAINSAPLIADLNKDKKAEIIIGDKQGYLYAWNTNDSLQYEWPTFRHDQWNTGNYHTGRPLTSKSLDATAYNNGSKMIFNGYEIKTQLTYTSNNKVFLADSYDPSNNWNLPIALGDGKYPSISVDGQGQANVVWSNTTVGGNVQLWARRDNESSASLLKDLGTSGYDYSLSCSPPSIAAKADTAYMVYLYSITVGIPPSVTAQKTVVFAKWPVGKYADYQEEIVDTWSWNPTGPDPRSPSICIDNKGYINLAWEKVGNVEEPGDIWWTVRYPSGSWHPFENLSNSYGVPSIEPTLNTYGNVHLAWEENGEIYYRECIYQPIPVAFDASPIPPQPWDPYVWGAAVNISQTPDMASLQPVFCDNYISYMEQQPTDDYEVMLYQKSNSVWQPIDGGNISQNPTQMSFYPHLSYDGYDLHGIWAERNDWGFGLKHYQKEVAALATFQANVGDISASPYTVQRDGYIVYGSAKSKSNIVTVDYDTTELIYQISSLDSSQKHTLEICLYQKNPNAEKRQYTVCVDDAPIQTLWVPSGQPTIVNKVVPPAVTKDGVLQIRVVKKKGEIVTCDWWQLYEGKNIVKSGGAQLVEDMPLTYIYALNQNAPNPFNSQTRINYQLAKPSNVSLKIYNITGQLVKTLVNDNQAPGYYSANWDGKGGNGTKAASGIYIYRLQAGDYVNTRKLVLLK